MKPKPRTITPELREWCETICVSLTEDTAHWRRDKFLSGRDYRNVGEVFEIVEPTSAACELE